MTDILVLSERWVAGGKENYIVSHFEHMSRNGWKVKILTGKKETNFFDERLKKCDIEIVELLNRVYSPMKRAINIYLELGRYLKKNKCDIFYIHADNGVSLSFSQIAKTHGVKKIIVHSHNSELGGGISRPIKILSHKIGKALFMNYPTDYWACSDLAAKWLFSKNIFYSEQYLFIKNGIDLKKFEFSLEKRREFRRKYDLDGYIVIGNIGRLNYQKNQKFLLSILKEMLKENSKVKLLIVGEGELEESLKEEAARLGVEQSTIFYGKSSNIQMIYSAMDVFALPSLFEGFPLCGVEAQVNGLPLIISDTVTKKIDISNNTEFLSIQNSDASINWSNVMLDKNRTQITQGAMEAYEIRNTAKQLEKNILGGI